MHALAEYELSYQLHAGGVDAATGLIRGATVAQADVQATGKFLLLDANGKRVSDAKLCVKKIPVFTDEMTLDTLMAAAAADGGMFKVRSDHDDALESRAGVAINFVRIGNRVTADLQLNTSYRDRDIVLETAQKSPKLIGLSIDMNPSFEVVGDKAFMRIEKLLAVDIVDEGAITHDGMFLRRGVDKEDSIKITQLMADEKKTPPTIEECMARISELAAGFGEMQKSISAMAKPAVVPPAGDEALKASITKISEQMSAIQGELADWKKSRGSLGLKSGGGATPTGDEVEAERIRLAAEKSDAEKGNKPKSFDDQVAALCADGKMKRSDAARSVMKSDPKAYNTKLATQGVTRMTA